MIIAPFGVQANNPLAKASAKPKSGWQPKGQGNLGVHVALVEIFQEILLVGGLGLLANTGPNGSKIATALMVAIVILWINSHYINGSFVAYPN